jgi:DNA-binding CsgD family transcriptional regulator
VLEATQGDRRASALLERRRELAEIESSIADARSGKGGLLVVEGAAGLGKTRLLEAARAAAADLRVLTARGTELERDYPFALVRQLFEPLLSAMGDPLAAELFEGPAAAARGALGLVDDGAPPMRSSNGSFAVLHGLYWLTAALSERSPLLLAVDDLHWADAASLDFLRFLLPRLEELPVLLVVACRPREPGTARAVLEVVTDPIARRVSPQPLSREAAGALISGELGEEAEAPFAAACHEVTGGNPFLLSELARALAARSVAPRAARAGVARAIAPDQVTRSVLVRLGRLAAPAHSVARALAILGEGSDHGLVAALGGLDARQTLDAADELRAAAILDPGAPLRFLHPLVRTALYADIPAGERAAAHAHAAALLRDRGARPEQIAVHLLASEPDGDREAVETLLAAGARAFSSGAPASAITYLMRALREPAPPDLRPGVLRSLMVAGVRTADASVYEAIEPDLRAELERNPQLIGRWAVPLSVWMGLNGRIDEAVPLLERGIRAAVHDRAYDRAFRIEAQLSSFEQLSPAQTRSRLERYREQIEPDSPNGRLAAAVDAAWCMTHGTAAQGAELARRALHEGKIFSEQPELLAPGWAMIALWSAGALDDARVVAERAVAIAQEHGAPWEMAATWLLRGSTAAVRGELAVAEADHRQAVHVARLGKLRAVIPLFAGALAGVLVDRGALDEAAAELERSAATTREAVWFSLTEVLRGRLLLARGRPQEALTQLVAFQRRMEAWGLEGMPFIQPRVWAARAAMALGDRVRARQLAEAELVHAERWGAAAPLARVDRALALTLDDADRIALLQQAVELLETAPELLERARALAELGAALRRARRRAAAREPLREALALARRCGAIPLAKHVSEELAATGERVRRYAPIGVESLTASERRVAEMAATGMTNREIAQALFLTVKTIEMHLSASYDKLGIRSRRLLADALDGGVAPPP